MFDIESDGVFEGKDFSGKAVGAITLINTGTAAATDVRISARFSNGNAADLDEAIASIPANATVSEKISLPWATSDRESGTLLVESASAPPLTVPFTVRETVNGSVFGWAALIAAAVAFLMTLLVRLRLKVDRRDNKRTTREHPPLGYVIYPGASWSFTGSWATSLTGVGAILGLVLAASGFLSDVFPGLAVGLIVA